MDNFDSSSGGGIFAIFAILGIFLVFTVGLILLSFIFYPMLGFGNYKYLGPSAQEAGGLKPIDPSAGYKDPFNNTPPPPQV